jgi:hypothetical protein
MSERVCVYVTLFGQYEDLLEQPIFADSAVDFICITDDPELESDSWQIRVVQPVIVTDPARSSRYPKICPHRFLEDYDVSLYIDNSVLLTRTPEEIVSALLPDGAGFSAVEHSFRETVLDEFHEVLEVGYETAWVCSEQLEHYRLSHPEVLAMKPLIGGVLIRRHMRRDVIEAMELWWFNVLRFSRRDQLSLRIALEEANLSPVTWRLDVHDSGYWRWPASTGRVRSRGGPLPDHTDTGSIEAQNDVNRLVLELQDRARRREQSLVDALDRVEKLSIEKNALSDQVLELSDSEALMRHRIGTMRSSNSWRYTAGLRSVGRWVRRRGRRA